MGSTGLIILLASISFLILVGLVATGNLLDAAKADSNTSTAATGASSVIGTLWQVLIICIFIVAAWGLIHAFNIM